MAACQRHIGGVITPHASIVSSTVHSPSSTPEGHIPAARIHHLEPLPAGHMGPVTSHRIGGVTHALLPCAPHWIAKDTVVAPYITSRCLAGPPRSAAVVLPVLHSAAAVTVLSLPATMICARFICAEQLVLASPKGDEGFPPRELVFVVLVQRTSAILVCVASIFVVHHELLPTADPATITLDLIVLISTVLVRGGTLQRDR